jgi:hypothetical protein
MPKGGFTTISKHDDVSSVEYAHILVGERITGAQPNIPEIMPFYPWPTQM